MQPSVYQPDEAEYPDLYAIKIKTVGSKRYEYLAQDGSLTRSKLHAARADYQRCVDFAEGIRANPKAAAVKIVNLTTGGTA